jgi:hypothetical protein
MRSAGDGDRTDDSERSVRWFLLCASVLGAAMVVVACVIGYRGDVAEGGSGIVGLVAVPIMLVCLTVAYLIAAIPGLLVHEGAHALVAWLLGSRPVLIQIGVGPAIIKVGRRAHLQVSLVALRSWLVLEPPFPSTARVRIAVVAAAGPIANLAVGVLSLWLAGGFDITTLFFGFATNALGAQLLLLLAVANLILAVGDLAPALRTDVPNDARVVRAAMATRRNRRLTAAVHQATIGTHGWPVLLVGPRGLLRGQLADCAVDADLRYLQVWTLLVQGDYRAALAAARAPVHDATPETLAAMDTLAAMAVLYLADPALYGDADAASARAFAVTADDPATQHTRGWLLIEMGRVEEGLALVRSVLASATLGPDGRAGVLATAALGEARLGNVATARQLCEQAHRIDPFCLLLPRLRTVLPEP